MAYSPTTWVSGTAPGISAANLNKIETGIADAHSLAATNAAGVSTNASSIATLNTTAAKLASTQTFTGTNTFASTVTIASGGLFNVNVQSYLANDVHVKSGASLYLEDSAAISFSFGHYLSPLSTYLQVQAVSGGIYRFYDAAFRPASDNLKTLGASGARWSAVWAANGVIQTSDPRAKVKSSMRPLAAGLDFVRAVQMDQWRAKRRNRIHYSPNLASVKAWIDEHGDFGGYIDPTVVPEEHDPGDLLGWRPSEFIPPLYVAVQELAAEVDALRARVA